MNPITLHAMKMAIDPPLPEDEINEHLIFIATVVLFQLNELNGKEFMRGFLQSASNCFMRGETIGFLREMVKEHSNAT